MIEKLNNIRPVRHHRRSIRLNGYDYSQSGLYFITICTQNKLCLFGKIRNRAMILNSAGRMTNKWWQELKCKYQNTILHGQITMPNHFHGIIEIINASTQTDQEYLIVDPYVRPSSDHASKSDGHIGPPLNSMVQWFKTMTTNEYIRGVKRNRWKRFDKRLWQRNYYEHIIRSEESYLEIEEYMRTNPMKWHEDSYYEPDHFENTLQTDIV